ncbi:MAG TPA: citrate synthase/methylcitrate synthase [Vicinamibacterales bacterium]|jgi:citrate synthase|nr:citrate synthase/methylcitrate synthase [Vicinamibacterales bacterium]
MIHDRYGGVMTHAGLEGIVAADTRLSHVDGERGELIVGGYAIDELATHATFEETTWLLWHGNLPSAAALDGFRKALAAARDLPPATLALLRECASRRVDPMDALRLAVDTLSLVSSRPIDLVARVPVIVAAYWRLGRGDQPIAGRPDLEHAANFLYMLAGDAPHPEHARALETYLNTVVDHGLNASTFTARVITSTGSDLVSAIAGALGALKGPLHGGAPGPALDMVFEIGDASRADAILRRKIEAGERLMGFGHRVYKVRDPRADVLAAAAERLFARAGDSSLYDLARAVEATAIRLLDEYKPGRRLRTNVEFYTALLLHGIGLDASLFTPTFAMSRVSGWIAHAREQQAANRIIRPQSTYVGPRGRRWIPISERASESQAQPR